MVVLFNIKGKDTINYSRIIYSVIIGTSIITGLCGGIYHLLYEFIQPKRIRKIISRPRLKYLEALGFKFDHESHTYSREFKSYYITISADSSATTGDSININVLVSIEDNQINLLNEIEEKYIFNSNDDFDWITNRIGFLFKTPNQSKFESELNNLINYIHSKNIQPYLFENMTT